MNNRNSKMFSTKKMLIGFGIIIIDIIVYILLGLLLMNYEDFYDDSKGEYWSLKSMSTTDIIVYFTLNFWHLLNIILIGYIVYLVIIKLKKTTVQNAN